MPIAVFCARTDDPQRQHIAYSTPAPCKRCAAEVMVSPATRRRLRPGDCILCLECMADVAEERREPWIITPRNADQLAELVTNGLEPEPFGAAHLDHGRQQR
jgi:hypothetical protein